MAGAPRQAESLGEVRLLSNLELVRKHHRGQRVGERNRARGASE